MLTASAKDPNRKDTLERRKANPESFGRTKIPKIRETIIIGGADGAGVNEALEAALATAVERKQEIRTARNALLESRETFTVAKNNLKDAVNKKAKAKDITKLEGLVEDAEVNVMEAEETLDTLIDAE